MLNSPIICRSRATAIRSRLNNNVSKFNHYRHGWLYVDDVQRDGCDRLRKVGGRSPGLIRDECVEHVDRSFCKRARAKALHTKLSDPLARHLRAHRDAEAAIYPLLLLWLVYVFAGGDARGRTE